VTHALAHHSIEKMGVISLLLIAYDFTRGLIDSSNPQGGLASTAVNFLLSTLALMVLPLAHSRKMETEADQVGLMLMAKAGYDPHAGVDVWTRMMAEEAKKKGSGGMPAFLSSHPASATRVERMRQWGKERQTDYEEALERAKREGRRIPQGQRLLEYRPTRSAAAIEQMDQERASAETSFQASALAVGPYRDVLNLKVER
jgi:predicted Zn-dependent protease